MNNFSVSIKKKQRADTINETKKVRAINLQGAIEKSPIYCQLYFFSLNVGFRGFLFYWMKENLSQKI